MKYQVYGLLLDSQEPWGELEPLGNAPWPADIRLTLESGDPPPPPASTSQSESADDTWLRIERDEGGYRLNFGDAAVFWVAADGRTIRCFPKSSPAPTLNHFLLDHVLPRTLDLLGKHPLHATAVATPLGVIAFLGATGTGKSTIAAALGRRGAALVSDDCLVLHRKDASIIATPSYAGLRLYDDVRETLFPEAPSNLVAHYSAKQRVTTAVPLATEPQALRMVFALERVPHSGTPALEQLGPADATMALTAAAFRMDAERREQDRRQLGFFADVSRRVPISRLVFSEDLSNIGSLAETILASVATKAS